MGAPPDAINLALGEPGWPLPDAAREALTRVAEADGRLPYGPNTGLPDLVEAVAAFCSTTSSAHSWGSRTDRARLTSDQVMVTAGSQAALFALFQAHVEPGSAVLVPDPGFVTYPQLARVCGADPITYPLAPNGDLDAEALVEVLGRTRHTGLVVLNHPANPTGGSASPTALAAVAQACARAGAVLVSDEVYRELWVDARPAGLHQVAGIQSGVVLGSMSKAFGAPGLRVGWASGPADLLAPARLVHNAMTTAPARPSQQAAVALLDAADEVLTEAREHVRTRWHLTTGDALCDDRGPELSPPATHSARAGIYLWLPLPPSHGVDDEEFALRLREEGKVTVVPGSAFGARGRGHVRVSLGGPLEELEEGLRRLAPWWER
ncbi:pyridoxal phosphate-dependent aminotransferase [Ornithinimicrobium sp. Y1694]|uniref:pyridoxal phosphate-dependent aminotransferase n=1 Tax=Ornithinimicrobium sp. Y1694 TaxID=3418590 RepID=UPI003CE6B66B